MFGKTDKGRNAAIAMELAVIGLTAVGGFLLAAKYNLVTNVARWMAMHEDLRSDELFGGVVVLLIGLGIFAVRRWRESQALVKRYATSLEDLQSSRQKAEESSRAKGEFLANMSHEIRTPMNAIIGMTDLTLGSQLTPEQREYLDLVKTSAQSLLELLNDILDFSKIEAGKLDLTALPFSLRRVMGETGKSLGPRAHEKGLELVCHIAPNVPDNLVGDPLRLRQVLLNLIGNGIKFTDRGEVAVFVDAENVTADEMQLHVTVRDTGVGISPAMQKLIFEAFTQGDGSATRRFGGTGLGLTIATKLATLMDGRIWVEGDLGGRSAFHFTAKYVLQKEVPQTKPTPKKTINLEGIPVLIVDDNATNRLILQESTSRWGMRPICVENGIAAIAAMMRADSAADPFRLVLLDVMMPGMDGLAVAEQIKAEPELRKAAIMLLSSVDGNYDAAHCRALGIAACLRKPITSEELYEAVVRALGGSDAAEASVLARAREAAALDRRLNVLVAEDSVVNQRVASSMLEKENHTVTIVNNGREALDALACERFDLVLMDVEMMEMDGLEATRRIRELEQKTGRHLPIIAMTARAENEDKENCLAAGMDDYISKPLTLEELAEVIQRTAKANSPTPIGRAGRRSDEPADKPNRRRETAASEPSPVQLGRPDDPVDFTALLGRVEQDLELLEEMIELFLSNSSILYAEIETGISQRDSEMVNRSSHALRGALNSMCATECAEAAMSIETISSGGELVQIDRPLSTLKEELQRVQTALARAAKEICECEC